MSKSVITDALLTAIADAIRDKTGDEGTLTPAQMAQAIEDIPAGAEEPYVEYTLDEQLGTNLTGAVFYGFTKIPRFFSHHTSVSRGGFNHIDIPDGVTEICDSAFVYSGLAQGITLPDSLRVIGNNAFEGSDFKSIDIPDDVETIGNKVFYSCTKLERCHMPEHMQTVNSNNLFYYCSKLQTVNFPAEWTIIDSSCFFMCSALAITRIPDTVTEIKDSAFGNTGLTDIDIMGACNIGWGAFGRCTNLKTVKLHSVNTTINEYAFSNDAALTDIYVPWASGAVAGAPWGATNASIHYNTQYDANGNVIS